MIISFTTIILSIIYSYTSAHTTLIVIIAYIIISYIYFIGCYASAPDELKTMKKHEVIITILLWPLLVILVTIAGLKNKALMKNKFPYRYHPSINPHIKKKDK